MKFEVVIREDKEDGGYVVNCPALPGCNSQGETVEEAQTNIKEAIEAYLESLEMDKIPLPSNSTIATVEM